MFLVELLHWRISPSGNRASVKKYENEDPNVVEIDFLFLFALVLCVVIRTNVVFLVKKTTWSLVGPTKTVWGSILFCLFGGG